MYIYIYSSIDRNIIINLCWKNIELYKLTMDQQTDKTPLLVLVVLLPVLQGLALVQVQLVTALPLPAVSPKCARLGRRIWMPVYDPYKPEINLLTVSGLHVRKCRGRGESQQTALVHTRKWKINLPCNFTTHPAWVSNNMPLAMSEQDATSWTTVSQVSCYFSIFFIDLRFAASAHLPGSTARLPKKS